MSKRDLRKLKDILTSIEKIQKYVNRGKESFLKDELIQTFFVRHIQIIGEASRKLSEDLREQYTEIPWKDIIGMRHFVVHEYTDVDFETVWEVVTHDVPKLKDKVQKIISEIQE